MSKPAVTIDINEDLKCRTCGAPGAVESCGLCLACITKRMGDQRLADTRFSKVKWNGERVAIEFLRRNSKREWDEYTMACGEEPRPHLGKALEALIPYGREILELPETDLPQLSCTGVSCSWNGDEDVLGAVLVLQKRLRKSSGIVNLVTPFRIERHYSGKGDDTQLMDPKMVAAIKDVHAEARRYLDGDRAQTNLFETAKGDK